MLFHSISGHVPGVDIEQVFCALHERVDLATLEKAWQRVVDRHEVLRTSFHWDGLAEPEQRVGHEVRVEVESKSEIRTPSGGATSEHLPVGQLPNSRSPNGEWVQWFEEWLETDRRRGFDVTKAPLMRLTLFRFGEREYLLVWTVHHLLLDARGIGMVLKEVFSIYDAIMQGEELDLPEPRSYREFIEWLAQRDTSGSERFWRERLEGFGNAECGMRPPSLSYGEIGSAESAERVSGQWLVVSGPATGA